MEERIHYSACPVCNSQQLQDVFQVKDYTVSQQLFTVVECSHCTARFTQDVPGPAAIAPYYKSTAYISHTNSRKGLLNGLYHWVRRGTLVRKRRLVQHATGKRTGSVLDVGSGVGAFIKEMQDRGWNCTGLEPDPDARAVAQKEMNVVLDDNSRIYQLPDAQFDAITLWHVLEHVHDLQGYFQAFHRLLQPGGALLIAVPNYTAADAACYKTYWAAYDVPRHLYHFSPRSMQVLAGRHGFRIEAYRPMWYDSFYVSLLSNRYRSGSYGWINAIWNGLRSNFKALFNTQKCSSVIYVLKKEGGR